MFALLAISGIILIITATIFLIKKWKKTKKMKKIKKNKTPNGVF